MGFWEGAAKGYTEGFASESARQKDEQAQENWDTTNERADAQDKRAQESHDLSQKSGMMNYQYAAMNHAATNFEIAKKAGDTQGMLQSIQQWSQVAPTGNGPIQILNRDQTPEAFDGADPSVKYAVSGYNGVTHLDQGHLTDMLTQVGPTMRANLDPNAFKAKMNEIGVSNQKSLENPDGVDPATGDVLHHIWDTNGTATPARMSGDEYKSKYGEGKYNDLLAKQSKACLLYTSPSPRD